MTNDYLDILKVYTLIKLKDNTKLKELRLEVLKKMLKDEFHSTMIKINK